MAQNNPINEASSYSTTGGANAPLNTGSGYGNTNTGPTTTHHSANTAGTGTGAGTTGTGVAGTTTNTTTTGNSTGSKIREAGGGIKGVLAGIHGVGEKVRGEFNSAVDEGFNEPTGVAKNKAVANAGDAERHTGQFAGSTKNREGALPGSDHERRY